MIDGMDGLPCYVGVGTSDKRMHSHIAKLKSGKIGKHNSNKDRYFLMCLANGFTPQPQKVAEGLSVAEAFSYEQVLIAWYGRIDLGTGPLLNANAGGYGGGRQPSPSTRIKFSERSKRMLSDPKIRQQRIDDMQSARSKKKRADTVAPVEWRTEQNKRIKAGMQDPQIRKTLSEKAKLRMATPEARAKKAAEARLQMQDAKNLAASIANFHNPEVDAKRKISLNRPANVAASSLRAKSQWSDPNSALAISVKKRWADYRAAKGNNDAET